MIVLPLVFVNPYWEFGFFIYNERVGAKLLPVLTSYNFVKWINPWILGAGNLAI